MKKHICPGCGAEIDCDTNTGEFPPKGEQVTDDAEIEPEPPPAPTPEPAKPIAQPPRGSRFYR